MALRRLQSSPAPNIPGWSDNTVSSRVEPLRPEPMMYRIFVRTSLFDPPTAPGFKHTIGHGAGHGCVRTLWPLPAGTHLPFRLVMPLSRSDPVRSSGAERDWLPAAACCNRDAIGKARTCWHEQHGQGRNHPCPRSKSTTVERVSTG